MWLPLDFKVSKSSGNYVLSAWVKKKPVTYALIWKSHAALLADSKMLDLFWYDVNFMGDTI
jgi:hypothetical protein